MNFRKILLGIVAIASLAACQKADPYMTLSEKKFTVGEDGGTINASISANVYYRVNNDMDWANIQIVGTEADATLFEITVDANPKTASRKGRIRFIGDSVTPLYIEITQDAKTPVGVNVTELNVNFNETSASFTVLGNKPWTASSDNDAFVLSATSGTGETDITVTFPENSKFVPVVANITVTIAGENYTLKLTQGAAPSTEKIDLSATATSNCYIVSKCGYYKFKATVRGTGNVPASCDGEIAAAIAPVKADVLWCTYNTTVAPKSKTELISGVALEDGYVVFNTADMAVRATGNVIIAVYSADDTILWTWHIWLTDEPAFAESGGANWMDRNLGAINAIRGDIGSSGLFYQWGRKDPLRSASTWDDGDFIETFPAPTDAEVEVATSETAGTIAASIANPRPFINTYPGGSGPKDWVFLKDHDDRWMDATKTMFDPCPAGYRLPTTAQMAALAVAGGLPSGSAKYSASADAKAAWKESDHVLETSAFCFPIAGYISYNGGTMLTDVGKCCKVVTSSRATAPSSYYLNANTSALNFSNSATCGHAAAARCVKE